MNHLKEKTRFVFLPLLILAVAFVIVYGLLYWLFYIKLGINNIKEDVVNYWIPVGLAFACVILFIRRRVHLLKLDADNGRIRGLYYMVASAVIVAPSIIMINYLDTATGKLSVLDDPRQIVNSKASKYYDLDGYVLDKGRIGIQTSKSYSGKRNQYVNHDIYIAIPVTSSLGDTVSPLSVFIGKKYHQQLSSKLSDEMQRIKWESFWDESFEKFDKDLIRFDYLKRMGNTETRDELMVAAAECNEYNLQRPFVILEPMMGPFNKRNGNKLGYFFLALAIGTIVWFLFVSIPGIHMAKVKKFASGNNVSVQTQFKNIYRDIRPRKGFIATPLLIGINVFVFAGMVLAGFGFVGFRVPDLIRAGAFFEPMVQKGDWWRFVSCMFLHGGFLHLLMNMISLGIAGLFLEHLIGTKKFTVAYFLSGIIASFVSMWWHDEYIVAVGASGAIFGLYGILLAFIICRIFDPFFNKFLLILLLCTAGFSLLVGILSEGIDNSAHIGGLLAGFVIGLFFSTSAKKQQTIQ